MVITLWGNEVDIQIPIDNFPTEQQREKLDELICYPRHGFFMTPHGKLHYTKHLPEADVEPKAVIIWQHGIMNFHGPAFQTSEGKYTNKALLIRALIKAGICIYCPDLIGHGYSEGARFFVPGSNWEVNRDHLLSFSSFVSQEHPDDVPFFLGGESYGANLCIHISKYWQDHDNGPKNFRGFVAFAPAIIGKLPSRAVVLVLRYGLAPFFPQWVPFFMPESLEPEKLWSDAEARAYFISEEYFNMGLAGAGRKFCLGTAVAMLGATEAARESSIPSLNCPFCVFHGTNDVSVPVSSSEFLLDHCDTKENEKSVFWVEGAYHDLLSDPDTREDTVDKLVRWINSRM